MTGKWRIHNAILGMDKVLAILRSERIYLEPKHPFSMETWGKAAET
jgi:hypothetical protein